MGEDDALMLPNDKQNFDPLLQEGKVAKRRALMYYKRKDYELAREAALSATQMSPRDPEGWLLLGSCEQKLTNYDEAVTAFEKYLELVPNSNKAPQVRQRITEMKFRGASKKKAEDPGVPLRFSGKGSGAYIGGSPVYLPKARDATDLASSIAYSFHAGFELDDTMSIGLRYTQGNTGPITVTDKGTGIPASVTGASHQIFEAVFLPRINLNHPYQDLGIFQIYIPIYLGFPFSRVSANGASFWNIGANLGSGLGVRIYTKSMVAFDILPLYYFGLPFWDLKQDSAAAPVLSSTGTNAKGSAGGFDLRLSITLFFR